MTYYFSSFVGYLEGSCRTGDLSTLRLRVDELEKIVNRFISLGTDFLLKTRDSARGSDDEILGCTLAMLAYICLEYSGDGRDFLSYLDKIDLVYQVDNDDYLALLERYPREAARFFSSRIDCSCIPEDLSCHHGYEHPPSGDPIYTFKKAYGLSMKEAMKAKTTIGPATHMKVAELLEEQGLSHLWDSEGKREQIISCLVSFGTDCLLETEENNLAGAAVIAIGVKLLELSGDFHLALIPRMINDNDMKLRWINSQSEMQKFTLTLMGDAQREVTKFFSSRNKCNCLKEKYKELKTESKKGICTYCRAVTEREKLKICNGCRLANYCSKSCQVSHL